MILDEGTIFRSLRWEHRGMKFLAAEFLRFSVPRTAPYGRALTPTVCDLLSLSLSLSLSFSLSLPASSYKRTKIRSRDETFPLPHRIVLFCTTFVSILAKFFATFLSVCDVHYHGAVSISDLLAEKYFDDYFHWKVLAALLFVIMNYKCFVFIVEH